MEIYIKQSDLISDDQNLNDKYQRRLQYIQQNIFSNHSLKVTHLKLAEIKYFFKGSPLGNKINHIESDLISYLFIVHNFSISEVSLYLNIKLSDVSWGLLNFFGDLYPDRFLLNNFLHVDDFVTESNDKKFNDLKKLVGENRENEEVFNSKRKLDLASVLESRDWDSIISSRKNNVNFKSNVGLIKEKSFGKTIASYLILLLFMSVLLFLSLKINEYNEAKLFSNLSIPSRFFTWLESSGSNFFTGIESDESVSEKTFFRSEESQEKISIEEDRFDVESDVVMTSLDQIDFGNERSTLEEIQKGQYRDTRYGKRKVYRIMITSSDIISVSEKISEFIIKYDVSKGGNVNPGAQLPGGLYYNLLVPTTKLKGFFSDIDSNEDMSIYLSRSKMYAPKGQSNVFIWVKKI